MYQTRILNEQEVREFNERFNTNYQVIHIQKKKSKYYAVLDCDCKIELRQKEALNYFI